MESLHFVIHTLFLLLLLLFLPSPFLQHLAASGTEILSKSKLESCVKASGSNKLDCTKKIVINMAVPSGSSGGEASVVAELVEVEENSTQQMLTIRDPPVVTINKSSAYALYEIMYIRDVAYKPQEFFVKTRKCEPDAGAKVVKVCERLRDENGHVIEHTEPVCCPCGPHRRVPSSCGNIFDKLLKGKANIAHCLRFPGEWFHVFGVGKRSLGFSIRVEVKRGSKISEVVVGPENRTVLSSDNFLRVNLIGDFVGYTSIPSFEDFYLVIPRQGSSGLAQDLGNNFSRWMLLERVRFTLDGLDCNKIGVSYEAYNGQPNFCSAPFWSCLHNQLWNFWEADQNRISRNQSPQYVLEGRFERINQHPNAGTHAFSIGVTEVLNTNMLIELSANDVQYVYQRSAGKILSVNIPTFEALTQIGTAIITCKNIGKLEASYSLTFECSSGVSQMEEQFFILKPEATATRSFKIYSTNDQAAKYECTAILKASDFSEVDRAKCQFTTTSTILDNGSQVTPAYGPTRGAHGIFGAIVRLWNAIWNGLVDFFTGKTCSWITLVGLLLATFPTVIVLLWLLHQKGLFDPLYDWWEDRFVSGNRRSEVYHRHGTTADYHLHPKRKHHKREADHKRMHHRDAHSHENHHVTLGDHSYNLRIHDGHRRVHKAKHKHRRSRNSVSEKEGPRLKKEKFEDDRRGQEFGGHRHNKGALKESCRTNRLGYERYRTHYEHKRIKM